MNACDCSCDSYDYEPASVVTVTWRKARKPHECCECGQTIDPGQRYEHVRGLWEDLWDTYETCEACVRIRKDYCPRAWVYGELRQTIIDCCGFDYLSDGSDDEAEEVTP